MKNLHLFYEHMEVKKPPNEAGPAFRNNESRCLLVEGRRLAHQSVIHIRFF